MIIVLLMQLGASCLNHLLKKKVKFANRDELWEHVETNHDEYFQGMMEVVQANKTKFLWESNGNKNKLTK